MDLYNILGIAILFTIVVSISAFIYLIVTLDPTGPSSRDNDGYKK